MEPLQNIKLSFKCPKQLNELRPCNGDWYCDGCRKMVYDFRGMTDAQVLESFVKNNYKMCGLFETDRVQVVPHHNKWFRWASAAMLFLGLTSCHDYVFGQTQPARPDTITRQPAIGIIYGVEPSFPDGTREFNRYLQKNLKLKKGTTGEVLSEITLGNEGQIIKVKIIKGTDSALNQQIIEVLKRSPKWVSFFGKSTALVHINLADILR
jgi:hypothetical protein